MGVFSLTNKTFSLHWSADQEDWRSLRLAFIECRKREEVFTHGSDVPVASIYHPYCSADHLLRSRAVSMDEVVARNREDTRGSTSMKNAALNGRRFPPQSIYARLRTMKGISQVRPMQELELMN